jgi:PAS domain S-box-containing protein
MLNYQSHFNEFVVDSELGLYHDRAGRIELQPKELAVLIELVRNSGRIVTKDELAHAVWVDESVSDSSIARCISKIKSAMDRADPGSNKLIKAIYGKGYLFEKKTFSDFEYLTEESFSTLINLSPDFIAFKDESGRWVKANRSALKVLDLENKNWIGKNDVELAKLIPVNYRVALEECTDSDEKTWESGLATKSFMSIPQPSNLNRYYELTKSPIYNKDGSRKMLVMYGHDVTDIIFAAEMNKLADHIFVNSREAVIVTDANNTILSVNDVFKVASGYTEEELVGKNPRLLSSGRHNSDFYQSMWDQIKIKGFWRGVIWDKRKNGEIYPKLLDISTIHNASGSLTNYIGVLSDLSGEPPTVD